MAVVYRKSEDLGLRINQELAIPGSVNDSANDLLVTIDKEHEALLSNSLLLTNNMLISPTYEKGHYYLKNFKDSLILHNGYYNAGILDFTSVSSFHKDLSPTIEPLNGTVLTINHLATTKTTALVLAGTLYNLKKIAPTQSSIDLADVPFARRLMNTVPFFDYTKTGLTFSNAGHTISGYMTDAFINALFTFDHTFLILFDENVDIAIRGELRSKLPGMFLTDAEVMKPIVNNHGVLDNYFYRIGIAEPGQPKPPTSIACSTAMTSAQYRHDGIHDVPNFEAFSDSVDSGSFQGYKAYWLEITKA